MAQEIIGLHNEDDKEFLLNRMNETAKQAFMGSFLKNLAYNLRYVAEHTWAGGAANTDTHTVTESSVSLNDDDIIIILSQDDSGIGCVKGAKASATTITLTTGNNSSDGKKFLILVFHKIVAES